MADPVIRDGTASVLGVSADQDGVNFALSSTNATAVELCLFAPDGIAETGRLPLPARTGDVFHGRVDGLRPGQLYGYRVRGPFAPEAGHRFNPNKLLIDPYARALHGPVIWDDAVYSVSDGAEPDLGYDTRDSARFVPKGVVLPPQQPAPDDRPRHPWSDTVIYEAHVKGLTRLHPDIPEPLRGTYEALAHPAVIEHLRRLGVTTLELLPIQAFVDDRFLVRRGLVNSWGYSTLNFFTPEARYFGPAGSVGLQRAVQALHAAGIEVILDVVYNHTAEAEEIGPTLSFRGIDNAGYYRLVPGDLRRYENITGCGNALDARQPQVRQLVLDSMRYWAQVFGIDGFRFDLAPVLGRDTAFSREAPLFQEIASDPLLGSLKLIAEPWDIGEAGYSLGRFPRGWHEWNDRFRDGARSFWRGDPGSLPGLARAVTGSRDVFEPGGRDALASINYVCSHDGYTVRDLVSYEQKHNWANGESNQDGHNHNLSCNYGQEGESDDPALLARRARQVRNLIATVFLSQGVPMLLMGDELSRSQGGNNNAYCQDNAVAWLDWRAGAERDPALPAFVARVADLRRRYPALRRAAYLTGKEDARSGLKDAYWLAPDGREMDANDWHDPALSSFGLQTGNEGAPETRILILVNASEASVSFKIGPALPLGSWRPVFTTAADTGIPDGSGPSLAAGGTFELASRSVVLFTYVAEMGQA